MFQWSLLNAKNTLNRILCSHWPSWWRSTIHPMWHVASHISCCCLQSLEGKIWQCFLYRTKDLRKINWSERMVISLDLLLNTVTFTTAHILYIISKAQNPYENETILPPTSLLKSVTKSIAFRIWSWSLLYRRNNYMWKHGVFSK